MPMEDSVPMVVEEVVGVVEKMTMVCRLPRVDKFMFFIIVRVCFVYGFRLVWN